MGLHLIKGEPVERCKEINPKADHVSFQAEDLQNVEIQLQKFNIEYVKQRVVEGEYIVTQIFFHDPDRNMVEICDCHRLPVQFLNGSDVLGEESVVNNEDFVISQTLHTPPESSPKSLSSSTDQNDTSEDEGMENARKHNRNTSDACPQITRRASVDTVINDVDASRTTATACPTVTAVSPLIHLRSMPKDLHRRSVEYPSLEKLLLN